MRDHAVPVELHWVSRAGCVRKAKLYPRGDTEHSLTFTAYDASGEQVAPLLHRVQLKRNNTVLDGMLPKFGQRRKSNLREDKSTTPSRFCSACETDASNAQGSKVVLDIVPALAIVGNAAQ